MTIIPISKTEPACFGVVCLRHFHCARYFASEGKPAVTIGTCENAAGDKPLFVLMKVEEVVA
jgi:hypothetical protein